MKRLKMAKFISPSRRCLRENAPIYFPFGSAKSRNILKDFKGSQNEKVKVLFLGCQDLTNVLTTIASKTNCDGYLTVHLNHSCPITFARNVLIVKVISAKDFNVNEDKDTSYLWDLWYNAVWPKSTVDRFVTDVKELVERGFPDLGFAIEINQFNELNDIWKGWLTFLDKSLTHSSQTEKILKERSEFISNGGRFGKQLLDSLISAQHISSTPHMTKLSLLIVSKMEIEDFTDILKHKLRHEVDNYIETGNCRSTNQLWSTAAINPTLLEPKTFRWRVNIYSCPFEAYLPLPYSELEMTTEDFVATSYCQKIMKNLVSSYRTVAAFINFRFSSNDDLQFFHTETTEKFDVIDCSTNAEDLGLANVLLSCGRGLASPDALLITVSKSCSKLASSTAQYVEEALCAPMSMIPTLYGFRLTNPVDLGCETYSRNGNFGGFSPITLTWSPATQSRNVPFCLSPAIDDFLKKLHKKCYFWEDFDRQRFKKNLCFKAYTPLTYAYVVSRLTQHDQEQGDRLQFVEVTPQFKLAQRSVSDWVAHLPVVLVTTIQPFTSELKTLFNKTKILFRAPNLRLVLIPSNHLLKVSFRLYAMEESEKKYPIDWATDNPGVHYIDNFELLYHKNESGRFRSMQLSFFLPPTHDLSPDHCAVLVEVFTGSVMMNMGAVADMEQQIIKNPCSGNSRLLSVSQNLFMEAANCQESPHDFVVEISIHSKDVIKGLSVATDQELPCEAAHEITFSFSEPEGISPLTLCFPHPFLVDFIDARFRRSDRRIRVNLRKALCEPWPVSFHEKEKWDVDCLSCWKQSPTWKDSVSELMFHMAAQKTLNTINNFLGLSNFGNAVHLPELRLLPSLEVVRNIIGTIFNFVEEGCDIFVAYNISTPKSMAEFALGSVTTKEPEFVFRVHRPILRSPCGSPMLLISVLDCRFSKKLVEKGHLQAEKATEYLQRVFVQKKKKQGPMIVNTTEEGSKLLRYVLRLNSTKMKPSSWQEKNLALDKYSPFLATYLSPLYREKGVCFVEEEDALGETIDRAGLKETNAPKLSPPNPCAGCGKQSCDKFKRCSRCKITAYCSIECQRSDWRKHKVVCAKSNH